MFKARMRFSKTDEAAYISHLDLMHCMQRVIARAQLPVWYTEGFNQHIYISIALPLSTGYSGECEFLDFNCTADELPADAVERMNAVMPRGLSVQEIYPLSDGGQKVREIAYSKFEITWEFDNGVPENFCRDVEELFARDEILILKRSKRGEKEVNIKDLMKGISLEQDTDCVRAYAILGAGNNNLSPEYVTKTITAAFPQYAPDGVSYHHLMTYDTNLNEFR
ncbi:MAG: TIGR03936 family radical SAM-associated protein [Butyricicoccus sp.]|jgi:radical SAM-linked protein